MAKRAAKPVAKKATKDASSGSASKRRLQRRDTSEAAQRAIREHFPRASLVVTEHFRVDGRTMKEMVKKDVRDARQTKARLGSGYWYNIQKKYVGADQDLKVADESELICESLLAALRAATTPNTTTRTRAPLRAWLSSCRSVNQKTMVGLARHISGYKPLASSEGLGVVLDYMKMCSRLKGSSTAWYDNELAHCADTMDDALCASWATLRREKISVKQWWSLHREVASLVVDAVDVDAIISKEGCYDSVAEALSRTTALTKVGAKLFGHATAHVVAGQLSQKTDELIRKMPKSLTEKHWTDLDAEIRTLALELDAARFMTERRTLSLQYRGLQIKVEASTWEDELAVRFALHCKAGAAGHDIDELRFEKGFFQPILAAQALP